MKKEPLASTILATYNGNHKWLSEAIESVLNQSFNDFELIIINDCSTNDIEKTILKYQQKDNRIVYIKNEKNLERSESRNKGIKQAKGKYIAFIDDDDIWIKGKLKSQVDFMEQNLDYGLCGTGVIKINENGKEINKVLNRGGDENIRKNITGSNQFCNSSIIINKEVFKKSGLFNYKYYLAEDYDLRLRIGKFTKINNLQEYLIKYRVRNLSTTGKNSFLLKLYALKISLKYLKYYPNKFSGICKNLINIFLPKFIIVFLVKLNKKLEKIKI